VAATAGAAQLRQARCWRGLEAGPGGANKRVCVGEWRRVGTQEGEAARRSRCGTGSGAGEPEEERHQSKAGGGKPAMQGGSVGA
jgi:hypothetical protein